MGENISEKESKSEYIGFRTKKKNLIASEIKLLYEQGTKLYQMFFDLFGFDVSTKTGQEQFFELQKSIQFFLGDHTDLKDVIDKW